MAGSEFSDDDAYYLHQLADSTPRPSKTLDRTPRPAKSQDKQSKPRRLSPSPARSSTSSATSNYMTCSSGSESTDAESASGRSHRSRATRSQTRELAAPISRGDTHLSLDSVQDSLQRNLTIDFAVAFDQPLPVHLVTLHLPESICRIADDLCRAWDARWVLSRAEVSAQDVKFHHWKTQSSHLIHEACVHRNVWPAKRLNRVLGLTRLLLDADPDWDVPVEVQGALSGIAWVTGGSQYAPSNMMAQLDLWSPVNNACKECASRTRLAICAVSAAERGKCYYCTLRSKTCSFSTGPDGDSDITWDMMLKKGKSRAHQPPSVSTANAGSVTQSVSKSPERTTGPASGSRATGKKSGTSKGSAAALSLPGTFRVETEMDRKSETLTVYARGTDRELLARVAYPNSTGDEEPLVYHTMAPDDADPKGDTTHDDKANGVRNVVTSLSEDIKRLIEADSKAQREAMQKLADFQRRFIAHGTVASDVPRNSRGGGTPQSSTSASTSKTKYEQDAKGKGTIPALRIGPWDAFRAEDADISSLVETLITELPHGPDFYLPTAVRRGKNAKFVFACFKDAENRDQILAEWTAEEGRYASILVEGVMVTREFVRG